MSGIFKKNDIRGVYPDQLNEEIVEKIGYLFSTYLKPQSAIAIAVDSRLSSNEIRDALVIGLNKGGIIDRKSTRLNSSHTDISRMPSSA